LANAQILYDEDVAATVATDTTWVTTAIIPAASFTANKRYLIIANAIVEHASAANEARVRLMHGPTPTVFTDASLAWEGLNSTQSHEESWLFDFTQPGTTEDILIQISSSSTTDVTNRLSQILAIKLDDDFISGTDYFWAEDLTDYTMTSTPTEKATTASFTPNGTDRWLFIGHMIYDVVSITTQIGFELTDSVAGVLNRTSAEAEDATNDFHGHNLYWVGVPSNAARTVAVSPFNSGSSIMLASRVIAINLSKFAQSAHTFSTAEIDPATSPSYTNLATISPEPDVTGDWVYIAFTNQDVNETVSDFETRLQVNPSGGGLVSDPNYSATNVPGIDNWDATDEGTHSVFKLRSLSSGGARTINFDARQVAGTTGRLEDNGLAAFSVALAAVAPTGHAQAQASIRSKYAHAQAQAQIILIQNAQATALINGQFSSVTDTFTRSVSDGWGTNNTGDTYVINTGSENFDVNGSEGTIQTDDSVQFIGLNNTLMGTTERGITASYRFKFDTLPTNGTNQGLFTIWMNLASGLTEDNGAGLKLLYHSVGGNFRITSHVGENNSTIFVFVGTVVINTWYIVEGTFVNSSNNTVESRFRVYLEGGTPPAYQKFSFDDSKLVPGHVGFVDSSHTGVFPLISIDDLSIQNVSWTDIGQAQAQITGLGLKFAQAQASIRPRAKHAQAQASIKVPGGHGQSMAEITSRFPKGYAAALISGTFFDPFDDTFTRTVVDSLGTSDNTDVWASTFGVAANADVNGTQGTISTTFSSQVWELPQTLIRRSEGREYSGTISQNILPAVNSLKGINLTGSTPSVIAGSATPSPRVSVQFNDTYILLSYIGRSVYVLASLPYAVGNPYNFIVRAIKVSNQSILITYKLWKVGDSEPEWSELTVVDTTYPGDSGHVRLSHEGDNADANAPFLVTFDNLHISNFWLTQSGQAQALIVLGSKTSHAQAEASILVTSHAHGQTQADIQAITNVHAQAQADILVTYSLHAQANADIKAANFAHAQSQADIKAEVYGSGQAQADIKQAYTANGQTQADILTQGYGHGQAQTDILAIYNSHAQVQTSIKATTTQSGQGQADIKATDYGSGQAQTTITSGIVIHAQTQANIKATSTQYGQTQADILVTDTRFSQAEAVIKQIYFSHGQAQGAIIQTGQSYGQTQSDIKAINVAVAQAQGSIQTTYNSSGQAQADIKVSYTYSGQGQALISRTEQGYGQAQGDIKATNSSVGQAQSAILSTTSKHANAQGWIKTTVNNYAQTQGYITTIITKSGQAEAAIQTGGRANAQAQALIYRTENATAQTQAFIRKSAGYGQARAFIHQPHELKKLRVDDVPTLVQTIDDENDPPIIEIKDHRHTTITSTDERTIKHTIQDTTST
jgi:hypothetical protein